MKRHGLQHLTFLVVFALQSGCATLRQPTAEEKIYISQMNDFVISTTQKDMGVSKNKIKDYWARAQSFVARFSDVAVSVASDSIIETLNPGIGQIGFKIVQIPRGDVSDISIICYRGQGALIQDLLTKRCQVNRIALFTYIYTEKEPPYSLVHDYVDVNLDTTTIKSTPADKSNYP